MAGDMDGMTREERQAFRSYVVPKPVCINKGEGHDATVLENLRRGLEENETFVVRGAGRLEASKGMEKSLERAKKFNIAIMDIPLIPDGSNMGSELMRYIVSDILLQVQTCMDTEKQEHLREKARRALEEKGMRSGPKPKERPEAFEELREKWVNWEISANKAAKQLGISHVTFRRWAREKGDRLAQRPEKRDVFDEVRKQWIAGGIPASEAAKQLGISQVAFLQRVMETP